MSRVLAAHQPNYLPWLGWLYKAGQADVFVLADDVQFSKHGYTNRNRIRTAEGCQWLTVPVRSRGRGAQRICDVEIDNRQPWARKHLNGLHWNYATTPHFEEHESFLETLYAKPGERLLDLNWQLLEYLLQQLAIEVEIRRSSEFAVSEERSQRITDLALACDCDEYLAGDGGSTDYLDESALREAGVAVRYAKFTHPRYPQAFAGFETGMCALDLLFNCGPRSREVLFG